MKILDLVKSILIEDEQTRNSDKLLIWNVYKRVGIVEESTDYFGKETISRHNFINSKLISTESITRARRKIQELNPELGATDEKVIRMRGQKRETKGRFIFVEEA